MMPIILNPRTDEEFNQRSEWKSLKFPSSRNHRVGIPSQASSSVSVCSNLQHRSFRLSELVYGHYNQGKAAQILVTQSTLSSGRKSYTKNDHPISIILT